MMNQISKSTTSNTPTKNLQKKPCKKPSRLTFFFTPPPFFYQPSHMACKYVILHAITGLGVAPHVEGDVMEMKG